jgi:hypothetical protein
MAYAAENWSSKLDDDFRAAVLSPIIKTFTILLLQIRCWLVMLSGIILLRSMEKIKRPIFYTCPVSTVT